ncbi:MAG: FAD/NAD(P)-binding oxidoreductase [Bacteroidota bacterium]|nr:FAD/NAD(P)-binding oxidoreductase [Bacteroidota bacterium]
MKRLVIVGAGTAGTMTANKLRKSLSPKEWEITILDKDKTHYYQPGFLFIPFGTYTPKDVIKQKQTFIPDGVNLVYADVDRIEAEQNKVVLTDGKEYAYDFLVIATGCQIRPEETPGLKESNWYQNIFDFYTLEGSTALHEFFKNWQGGRLVVTITELPFKCPVAPLEFAFLADAYFTRRGIRDKVEIIFTTPMSGAFTKPKATAMLGKLLADKHIQLIPDFYVERVDSENNKIYSYDGKEMAYDCLTIVPVNMGDDMIARSGLGDDLNYVPTDKNSLRSVAYENIFVLGDASNIPASKAGAVAHFSAEVLVGNLLESINGQPMSHSFDGHANCYIETGNGKASLIDFNYDTEPLPGKFPVPGIGPFSLLGNTRINHLGKLAFKMIYWEFLLKDRKLPISNKMSMSGKIKD